MVHTRNPWKTSISAGLQVENKLFLVDLGHIKLLFLHIHKVSYCFYLNIFDRKHSFLFYNICISTNKTYLRHPL